MEQWVIDSEADADFNGNGGGSPPDDDVPPPGDDDFGGGGYTSRGQGADDDIPFLSCDIGFEPSPIARVLR